MVSIHARARGGVGSNPLGAAGSNNFSSEIIQAGNLAPEDRERGRVGRVEPVAHALQAAVAVLAAAAEGEAAAVALIAAPRVRGVEG